MPHRPIYLDYMATTPVDPRVIEAMMLTMGPSADFGNPASASHGYGFAAKEHVDKARQQVATAIGAEAREIVWTSGATESNNLALQGAAHFYQRRGKHIITLATEHKAVLDVMAYLASNGFEITYLRPQPNGLLDLNELAAALRADTILVSVMWVNNETGVVQDLAAIAELVKAKGALLHVDAAQAIGKVEVDVSRLPIDLLSLSAHKVYGPKGVGALYVRREPRVRLQPLLYGGGHEHGLRSGTLAVHQLVGMGAAYHLAQQVGSAELPRIAYLRERLWAGLSALGGVYQNTDTAARVPHCLNVFFDGVDGEALLVSLRDVAVSSGSACNSANPEPSHVLLAMGLTRVRAHNSLRLSLGRFTTEAQIDQAIAHFATQLQRLRAASPIWDRVQQRLKEQ